MADETTNPEELGRIAELYKIIRGEREATVDAESKIKEIINIDKQIQQLQASKNLQQDTSAAKQLQLEIDTQKLEKQTKLLQIRKDAAVLDDEAVRNQIIENDLLGKGRDETEKTLNLDRERVGALDDQINKQERISSARQKSIEDMRTQSGLASQLTDSYDQISQVIATGNVGGALNLAGQGAQKAAAGFQKATGLKFPGFLNTATAAALGLQDAIAKFNEDFRFGKEYTDRIEQTYFALAQFGVTAQEAGEAQAALIKGVSDFTLMSKEQRDVLVEQVALLNEIGVSAQTSAALIQNSIKIMGTNVDETDNLLRRLTANAKELGFEQEQYMAAFATMGKDLAKLGSEGEMAFKKLAHASRITGMEMSRILTLTSEFDTFEGAATQAGKLNAALGGNFVNAMDLMMATDPAERFGMIRDSILDTGLAFNDMSYFQRLFYVDALGLSDVGELAQVLSGDFDDLSGSVMASEETLLEQKKAAEAAKSVQETLNNAIAANSQTITTAINTVSKFTQTLAQNPDIVKNVISGLAALKAASIGIAITSAIAGTAAAGMGVSMLGAAAGVAALGAGFYYLKDGLMIKSPSFIMLTLLAMIPIIFGLGAALNFATPGLSAFGTTMALTGVGILAASYGLSLLVPKFTELLEAADPADILSLGTAMTMLIGSFALLGSPVGLLALGGVAGLSLALRALPDAASLSGFEMFTSNLLALTGVADRLGIVANEIEKIGEAIETIPNEKTIRMTAMLDKMQSTMLAAATAPVNVTSNILQAANNATTATTAATGPQVVVKQPIDIYLDKSKIGDFTMDIFADRVIGEIAKAR